MLVKWQRCLGLCFLSLGLASPATAQGLRFKAQTTPMDKADVLILLNNCDDSDKDGKIDNQDNRVNGPLDGKQLEPIKIEGQATQGPITLKLVFDTKEPFPVRLFRITKQTATGDPMEGEEILGPTKKNSEDPYFLSKEDLDDLAANRLTFLAEGLQFVASAQLVLRQGTSTREERLTLQVAPVMLLPHTQPPVLNMVVHYPKNPYEGPNTKYVEDFEANCKTAQVKSLVIPNPDRWIEDEMQWGLTETPRLQLPVVLHLSRRRANEGLGPLGISVSKLLQPGIGYFPLYRLAQDGHALYFGGNIEISPPTAKYPFGRVYYGNQLSPAHDGNFKGFQRRQMNKEYVDFFHRQKLQDPVELWTDWLSVGHIDEVVTFLPGPNETFVMALASPKLALTLLDLENLEGRPDRERGFHEKYQHYRLRSIDDLKDERKLSRVHFLGMGVERYNNLIHSMIFGVDFDGRPAPAAFPSSIKNKLMKALDLTEKDVVEVPVLYGNQAGHFGYSVDAISPGMVNLSSMGKYCMIPQPFVEVFQTHFEKTLQRLGLTPLWIDDWSYYHIQLGEVHCGSNTLRQPFTRKWWQVKQPS
jgi:protein-arginine deiminase